MALSCLCSIWTKTGLNLKFIAKFEGKSQFLQLTQDMILPCLLNNQFSLCTWWRAQSDSGTWITAFPVLFLVQWTTKMFLFWLRQHIVSKLNTRTQPPTGLPRHTHTNTHKVHLFLSTIRWFLNIFWWEIKYNCWIYPHCFHSGKNLVY